MKKTLIVALCLFAASAHADFASLTQSLSSTFGLVAQGHLLDNLSAVEAVVVGDEVETKALLIDGTRGQEELLEFGCHAHGPVMACHPEGHTHLKSMPFSEFLEGIRTAVTNIERSFTARNIPFSAIESLKFWKAEDHGHALKSGDEAVWGKVVYEQNGADETLFIECHEHKSLECHFGFSGNDEPTLGDDHGHDDDHDHDDHGDDDHDHDHNH